MALGIVWLRAVLRAGPLQPRNRLSSQALALEQFLRSENTIHLSHKNQTSPDSVNPANLKLVVAVKIARRCCSSLLLTTFICDLGNNKHPFVPGACDVQKIRFFLTYDVFRCVGSCWCQAGKSCQSKGLISRLRVALPI